MAALTGKVVVVIGNGTLEHRSVAVAMAESGADIAVAGNAGVAEVLLHSIANEIWALGRRSMVVGEVAGDSWSFAVAVGKALDELAHVDLVVRVEPVLGA